MASPMEFVPKRKIVYPYGSIEYCSLVNHLIPFIYTYTYSCEGLKLDGLSDKKEQNLEG